MLQGAELNRLRWHCRRGMLENDLVLEKFLDRHSGSLEGERLEAFRGYLALDDTVLWALLSGRTENPANATAAEAEILAMLRAC